MVSSKSNKKIENHIPRPDNHQLIPNERKRGLCQAGLNRHKISPWNWLILRALEEAGEIESVRSGSRGTGTAGLSRWGSWRSGEFNAGCPNLGESLLELPLWGVDEGVRLDPADFASNSLDTIAAHSTLDVSGRCSSSGDGGVLDVGGLAHELPASLHDDVCSENAGAARKGSKRIWEGERSCEVD